jgi:hypothetical protein
VRTSRNSPFRIGRQLGWLVATLLACTACHVSPRTQTEIDVRDPNDVAVLDSEGHEHIAPGPGPRVWNSETSCGALCTEPVVVKREADGELWLQLGHTSAAQIVQPDGRITVTSSMKLSPAHEILRFDDRNLRISYEHGTGGGRNYKWTSVDLLLPRSNILRITQSSGPTSNGVAPIAVGTLLLGLGTACGVVAVKDSRTDGPLVGDVALAGLCIPVALLGALGVTLGIVDLTTPTTSRVVFDGTGAE